MNQTTNTEAATATTEQQLKIKELIQEFSKDQDIINFVNKTEKSFKLTQDHYGDYMAFLSPYSQKASALYIISQALILAGANYNGVVSALRVIKGE